MPKAFIARVAALAAALLTILGAPALAAPDPAAPPYLTLQQLRAETPPATDI